MHQHQEKFLSSKMEETEQQWDLLSAKLSALERQKIRETRVEERFRIDQEILLTKEEREVLEQDGEHHLVEQAEADNRVDRGGGRGEVVVLEGHDLLVNIFWKRSGASGRKGLAVLQNDFCLFQDHFFPLQNAFFLLQCDFCRSGKTFLRCNEFGS